MYENYFTEYHISDEKLKQKIYQTLKSLIIISPEEYSADLLGYANQQQSVEDILINLTNLIPAIKNIENGFGLTTATHCLMVMAIQLDIILYTKRLEYLLLKLIHMSFSTQLLSVRFLIATEIIEEKLGEKAKYDSDLIFQNLLNPSNKGNKFVDLVLAEEEIARVSNNETVREDFWELVEEFETSVEGYIQQGLPNIVFEMLARIFFEGMLTNINFIDSSLGLDSSSKTQNKRDWVNEFLKFVRFNTNYRLGVKHGGVREKEGFVWTKERQMQFFEMVESIPKINRKKNGVKETIYVWDYIYEQFNSRGAEAKDLMKAEAGCNSISPELLDEAFEKWQKCEDSYTNLDKEYSPKMFLYRHALQLLDYPDGYFNKRENKFSAYKKSTLQKHYDTGEKTVMSLGKQDETCLSENASGVALGNF